LWCIYVRRKWFFNCVKLLNIWLMSTRKKLT
jgi:hypothetical protein